MGFWTLLRAGGAAHLGKITKMAIFRRGKGVSGGILRAEFVFRDGKGKSIGLPHKLFEPKLAQN